MLAIKMKSRSMPGHDYWYQWHIGEAFPELDRVVTFQADGDELNLFIDAMVASKGTHPNVDYTKMGGFIPKNEITRL